MASRDESYYSLVLVALAYCRHDKRGGALGAIMAITELIDRGNDNGGEGGDNLSNERQGKKRLEEKFEVFWEIRFSL